MDITLDGRRRIPAVVAVVAIVAATGAAAWFFLRPGDGIGTGAPPESTLDQARWKITAHAASVERPTAKERTVVRRREPALAALVKDVYDALLLDRDARRETIRRYFNASGGKAFFARGVDISKSAAIRTRRRRADIGIDAQGATRAAASITVVATIRDGSREKRITHRADLYLEKQRRGWKVIGFAVDQRAAGKTAGEAAGDGDPDRDGGGKGKRRGAGGKRAGGRGDA